MRLKSVDCFCLLWPDFTSRPGIVIFETSGTQYLYIRIY